MVVAEVRDNNGSLKKKVIKTRSDQDLVEVEIEYGS